MTVEVMCNGERINSFDGWDWGNPFDELPQVGDYVELGAHCLSYEPQQMKKYKVLKKTFSAVVDYNKKYSQKKCVVEVQEVNI